MNKEQLKQKYKDEKVLVIPRWYYEQACKIKHDKVEALMHTICASCSYEYRYEAELDEANLQVIPYIVMRYKDKYFITKRLGGDERLKGMVAFLGGHVDECDYHSNLSHSGINADNTIINCIIRELEEETTMNYEYMFGKGKFITTFIDDSAPVSRVHVCLLTIVDVLTDDIKIRETDKLEGGWVTLDELKDLMDQGKCEGWCKITINKLLEEEQNGKIEL